MVTGTAAGRSEARQMRRPHDRNPTHRPSDSSKLTPENRGNTKVSTQPGASPVVTDCNLVRLGAPGLHSAPIGWAIA
ncbi:hypothetical protein MNBD_ACTINO02-1446 [hydrothermal vent metagenome]|uniref:Uncharacterized protein n=1 Tax=hydrothermal vent metagenome TaxID=652676 RepID=A0A3B0TL57_9ZZZZ